MDKVRVTFSDGQVKEFPKGVALKEIAQQAFPRELNEILAAQVNGNVLDLFRTLDSDAQIEFLTFNQRLGKEVLWHSTAHVIDRKSVV